MLLIFVPLTRGRLLSELEGEGVVGGALVVGQRQLVHLARHLLRQLLDRQLSGVLALELLKQEILCVSVVILDNSSQINRYKRQLSIACW